MIDKHQKGWALRYLREAEAELSAARKMPYLSPSLILDAVRKAQSAIYFSLGEPSHIRSIVNQTILGEVVTEDPALRLLVDIERKVQKMFQTSELDPDKAIKEAYNLINTASDIVKLFTDEKS
jgi:hypothetical protein